MPDFAALVTPPLLLDSTGAPANGDIYAKTTRSIVTGSGIATPTQVQGKVIKGEFKALNLTPFELPVTPDGVGIELFVELLEVRPHGTGSTRDRHQIRRTVSVPNQATVTWVELVDLVAVEAGPDVVVPTWVADAFAAKDLAVEAATTAENAKTTAQSAASTATTAATAAQAVGTTNDTVIASRLNDDTSAAVAAGRAKFGRKTQVSVLDHGAVGDFNGTTGTDNLAAFNAAFAAVPNGGTVWVPPGRYYFTGTLVFPAGKAFNFDCGGSGFKLFGTSATQLVFAAGVGGLNMVGVLPRWRVGPFAITSLSTTAGSDVGIFSSSGRGEFSGTTVESFGSHGLHMKAGTAYGGGNANNTVINQMRAYANRGDGIKLEGNDANAILLTKPDTVANYGWGINMQGNATCYVLNAHADQQYNGSPGAFRDAGNSNNWQWPYAEGSGIFLIDTGSSSGVYIVGAFGRPLLQTVGAGYTTWTINDSGRIPFTDYFPVLAGGKKFRTQAGSAAADSFDIIQTDDNKRVLSVDGPVTRAQWYLTHRPNVDATYDMGQSALRWRNGYFSSFVRVGAVATGSRPTAASAGAGGHMFDTTLGKPIWSDGTSWKDATGTVV